MDFLAREPTVRYPSIIEIEVENGRTKKKGGRGSANAWMGCANFHCFCLLLLDTSSSKVNVPSSVVTPSPSTCGCINQGALQWPDQKQARLSQTPAPNPIADSMLVIKRETKQNKKKKRFKFAYPTTVLCCAETMGLAAKRPPSHEYRE